MSQQRSLNSRLPWTTLTDWQLARDGVSLGGLLVSFGAVATVAGPTGALLAAPFFVAALFVQSTVAFLVGQIALLVGVTLGDVTALIVTQVGLFAVLTEPARDQHAVRLGAATALLFVAFGGLVAVGLQWSTLAAGVGLLITVTIAVYITHRYGLVRLGLVKDNSPPEAGTTDSSDTMENSQ